MKPEQSVPNIDVSTACISDAFKKDLRTIHELHEYAKAHSTNLKENIVDYVWDTMQESYWSVPSLLELSLAFIEAAESGKDTVFQKDELAFILYAKIIGEVMRLGYGQYLPIYSVPKEQNIQTKPKKEQSDVD